MTLRNRLWSMRGVLLLAVCAINLSLPAKETGVSERADDYLDTSLPKAVRVAPYAGERYQAEIPDTLELVDHANAAINQGTRLWAPDWGYEQLFGVWTNTNPPLLEMGHGGLLNCGPKVIEALPMLRVMTGSNYKVEEDGKAMAGLLRITGKDGLCYQPVQDRPWAFFEEPTRKIGKPYSDIFGEARQILAYAAWHQHDKNPLWRKLTDKKVWRLREMTLGKDDTFYFRLSRGYTPWDKNPKEGPVVPIGDHNVYDPSQGMTGTAASYIVGWMPMAGAIWKQIAQDEEVFELGGGLARYLYRYGKMIDPDTGRFLADHESHVTHSLLSQLSWALAANDKAMIEWVRKGYEFHIGQRDPDRTGIVYGKEACSVADVIGTGVMLSEAGVGDYWDNVDRWVRNTFLDMQLTSTAEIEGLPVSHPQLKPGFVQPDDAADRAVGTWRIRMEQPTRSIGCCNGNCPRILYYVWNNLIRSRNNELRVNLLMNRASPWADLDSWVPYEGKIELRMKKSQESVLVHIPGWTEAGQVKCIVNGKAREAKWSGRYVNLGGAKSGDRFVVEFPMKQWVVATKLNKGNHTVTLKGNTVIDVVPPEPFYPIENHVKYRNSTTGKRRVTRFVSTEQFVL